MRFHVLTLFPQMIEQGLSESITGRALKQNIISLNTVNIRDFAHNKHNKVDDYTYGGGAGMLMQAEQRRQAILNTLRQSDQPVSAGVLAERFSVSRQIVVGDVALLRATGADITATPRGYVMQRSPAGLLRQIVCRHSASGMEAELNAMVDNGCTVLDVIVDHPVYGQLTGPLQLSSRYDVQQFLDRCAQSDARPLSDLTEGIHLHTISCPDEASWQRVLDALRRMHILIEA